jgi:hypothetical protein
MVFAHFELMPIRRLQAASVGERQVAGAKQSHNQVDSFIVHILTRSIHGRKNKIPTQVGIICAIV